MIFNVIKSGNTNQNKNLNRNLKKIATDEFEK